MYNHHRKKRFSSIMTYRGALSHVTAMQRQYKTFFSRCNENFVSHRLRPSLAAREDSVIKGKGDGEGNPEGKIARDRDTENFSPARQSKRRSASASMETEHLLWMLVFTYIHTHIYIHPHMYMCFYLHIVHTHTPSVPLLRRHIPGDAAEVTVDVSIYAKRRSEVKGIGDTGVTQCFSIRDRWPIREFTLYNPRRRASQRFASWIRKSNFGESVDPPSALPSPPRLSIFHGGNARDRCANFDERGGNMGEN